MISSLHHDDVHGKCGFETYTWKDFENTNVFIPKRNESTFPLLRTINEAIAITLIDISANDGNSVFNCYEPSHIVCNAITLMVLINWQFSSVFTAFIYS